MPDFETFVARHSESGVQALVEQMERYEGTRPAVGSTLEERWEALMSNSRSIEMNAAA